MRRLFSVAWLIVAAGLAGCSEDHSTLFPTAPTVAVPASTVTQIRAFIADSAFRTLDGVRVEILDGMAAGQSATTDRDGIARLSGEFNKDTRFQASKAGYETLTSTWRCSVASCPSNGAPYVLFYLRPLAAP